MSAVEDGWDDDDGFFGSDDDEGEPDIGEVPMKSAVAKERPPSSLRPPTDEARLSNVRVPVSSPKLDPSESESAGAGDGWGDDDDALDFEDDDQPASSNHNASAVQVDAPFDSHPKTNKTIPSSLASTSEFANDDRLYRDLEAYILSLDRMTSSINAVLEDEYNSDSLGKAREIVQYYADRPGLASYTIDKELSRMEYVVTLPPSSRGRPPTTISDKNQIADILKQVGQAQRPSLLARCSNQSILADLLQVCTGPDRLVRPQFMASAVAHECRFHLDFVSERLHVEAHLSLSIPTASGRWEVARIVASVEFVPHPHEPSVRYRLDNVQVVSSPQTDPMFQQRMRSAVEVLRETAPDHPAEGYNQSDATGVNFRDVFLQQSQSILLNSADGMQSAWKEFEQVAGIKSKLMNLPGFLPDDVLNAAEAETFTLQAEKQQEQMKREEVQQRPKSILGGLVRSGFKKLAQQVALPTEDPSIYEDWSSQAARAPTRPREATTPRQGPHTPQLQLHGTISSPTLARSSHVVPPHTEERHKYVPILNRANIGNPIQMSSSPGSRLSAPDVQVAAGPVLPSNAVTMNPSVQDGWGDDEDDLFETEDRVEASVPPPPPPPAAAAAREEDMSASGSTKPFTSVTPADERPRYLVDESKQVPVGWTYDPGTGVIPTRKRWTNPYQNHRFE